MTTDRYLCSLDTKFTGGCRRCGGAIHPPRRTFCSAGCVHEHKLRTNGTYLRNCTFRRDNAVCVICGFDTKDLAKRLRPMTVQVGRRGRDIRPEFAEEYERVCKAGVRDWIISGLCVVPVIRPLPGVPIFRDP